MEIDLHFNRSSSSHLNTYKVRIFGTIVLKTLSYTKQYSYFNFGIGEKKLSNNNLFQLTKKNLNTKPSNKDQLLSPITTIRANDVYIQEEIWF